jgi:hypothetical protein
LIALSLLLAGCSRRARIAGTWHDQSGRFSFAFNSDGSFISGEESNRYAGTWQINGPMLTMRLTNATGPNPGGKVGDRVQFRIISVDSHVLSLKIGGQTNVFSR